jgi:hypothetical protein
MKKVKMKYWLTWEEEQIVWKNCDCVGKEFGAFRATNSLGLMLSFADSRKILHSFPLGCRGASQEKMFQDISNCLMVQRMETLMGFYCKVGREKSQEETT